MIEINGLKTSPEDSSKILFYIKEDDKEKNVWLKVNDPFKDFLVTDRVDGIIIGLLNYAMRNGHNIKSSLPISRDLAFKLNNILIPNLVKENPIFSFINIQAPTIDTRLGGKEVGTGISCGIDSLYTLKESKEIQNNDYKIKYLVTNNVGQHTDEKHGNQLFKNRCITALEVAEKYGYELVICDSNIQNQFKQNHYNSHTYVNLFPIHTLAKLFAVYFYASSGISLSQVDFTNEDSAASDPIILPLLSTSNISFYSGGLNTTRMEKTKALLSDNMAQNYLNVCVSEYQNCMTCEKCVRTTSTLYALNSLEKFSKVFNIDFFKEHKKWFLEQVYFGYVNGGQDYHDIYSLLKNEISIKSRIKVRARLLTHKIFIKLSPLYHKLLPHGKLKFPDFNPKPKN